MAMDKEQEKIASEMAMHASVRVHGNVQALIDILRSVGIDDSDIATVSCATLLVAAARFAHMLHATEKEFMEECRKTFREMSKVP